MHTHKRTLEGMLTRIATKECITQAVEFPIPVCALTTEIHLPSIFNTWSSIEHTLYQWRPQDFVNGGAQVTRTKRAGKFCHAHFRCTPISSPTLTVVLDGAHRGRCEFARTPRPGPTNFTKTPDWELDW